MVDISILYVGKKYSCLTLISGDADNKTLCYLLENNIDYVVQKIEESYG